MLLLLNPKKMPTRNTSPVIIKLLTAVLKPSTTEAGYINNAKGVRTSILGLAGSTFPPALLSVTMGQFNTDVTDLDVKEAGLHTSPPTHTAAERNAAKKVVAADQVLLLSDVTKIARRTPATGITIIESANFAVKKDSAKTKFVGAKNKKGASGTIIITAAEPKGHEWAQLAADNVTWIYLRATTNAKKTVTGLTPRDSITFKSAPILPEKDGESAFTIYPPIIVT